MQQLISDTVNLAKKQWFRGSHARDYRGWPVFYLICGHWPYLNTYLPRQLANHCLLLASIYVYTRMQWKYNVRCLRGKTCIHLLALSYTYTFRLGYISLQGTKEKTCYFLPSLSIMHLMSLSLLCRLILFQPDKLYWSNLYRVALSWGIVPIR